MRDLPTIAPCPFCGGKAHMHAVRDGRQVGCHTCLANGPAEYHGPDGYEGAEQRAIDAWNRRAGQRLAAGAEAEQLAAFANNLAANQQSLPPEMADVLYGNLDKLYRGKALAPGGRDEHCWFDFALPYPQPPSAPQAVPSYQQAYEANCALVTALDRIRDIIDGKAPASDMGIHEIVNRALTLHRLAAPPAPSSEQPKETT